VPEGVGVEVGVEVGVAVEVGVELGVAVGVDVGVGVAVGVAVGDGVGVGTRFRTSTVIVEDAIKTLLLLYALIAMVCSPFATGAEFQLVLNGGDDAINLLST
jgi:hypothetical protein